MNFTSIDIDNDTLMMIIWGAGAVTAVLTAYLTTIKVIRPFAKRILSWINTWENFMSDWAGEPDRPGVPGRAGVMERLHRIDEQLHNNGGSSIKDSVDRIERRLEDGDQKFEELSFRILSMESDIKELKSKSSRAKKAS